MPLNLGNNLTALIDGFDKPESAHCVGNLNQWIGYQPGGLGTRPTVKAGAVGPCISGVSGSGGAAYTEKIYPANQKLSCRLVARATDDHEEFQMIIKYNPLAGNYYRVTWYTSTGSPTYSVQKVVNGSSTTLAGFPSWSPVVGSKLSFQWKNGVLAMLQNDSVIASFNDNSVPGPGKVYFGFFLEGASSGAVKVDNFMVEEPGAFGAGVGQPVPQVGWDL